MCTHVLSSMICILVSSPSSTFSSCFLIQTSEKFTLRIALTRVTDNYDIDSSICCIEVHVDFNCVVCVLLGVCMGLSKEPQKYI